MATGGDRDAVCRPEPGRDGWEDVLPGAHRAAGRRARGPGSIVEINAENGKLVTLFDPLDGEPPGSRPPPVRCAHESLSHGRRLRRLVAFPSPHYRQVSAFDPVTRTWQHATASDWQEAVREETMVNSRSRSRGMALVKIENRSAVAGAPGLRVKRLGAEQEVVIPLLFDKNACRPDGFSEDFWSQQFNIRVAAYSPLIRTPTSLLIPFFMERGFWEIPYADIQQWLTDHPTPPKGN